MKIPIGFTVFALLVGYVLQAQSPEEKQIQRQLISVKNGDTVQLPAGHIAVSRTLWMDDKHDLVIMGRGEEETILDFQNQIEGAEGLKITNSTNITMIGFSVKDPIGDGIKTQDCIGVVFRNIRAFWSGKPSSRNGGYGLYPVLCSRIVIDSCEVYGAADAGIYVGQSEDIEVKNSTAHHNVAGIEIENSEQALVHHNNAHDNTGGILVFDLPDLTKKRGGQVRVYRNRVYHNDHPNFAARGNIVGKVPPGTGILVLATNHVEIDHNEIIENNTLGTGIISYYMTELPIKDSIYYPYPTYVKVHHNIYQRDHVKPSMKGRFGKMFRFKLKFGKEVPNILYDGILDEKLVKEYPNDPQPHSICIYDNENQSFASIDAENDFRNISRDIGPFQECKEAGDE